MLFILHQASFAPIPPLSFTFLPLHVSPFCRFVKNLCLQRLIKEKEDHINQLHQEREIERSDLARATLEREMVRYTFPHVWFGFFCDALVRFGSTPIVYLKLRMK